MKIEIDRDDLAYATSAVERAAGGKNVLSTLGGVLLSAAGDRVSFRATDLELAIECVISARVLEEGQTVTPARRFSSLVKLLPAGDITLTSFGGGNERMEIAYSGGKQLLPGFPADDFPLLPQREGNLEGSIPARAFRRMVRQVGIAAATDEMRPVFTGVLCELSDDSLTMVATDTHRLAKVSGPWQGNGQASLLIPNRSLQEVARLAVNDEDNLIITAGRNQVYFTFANMTVTSRLIAGQFPDYRQVIPRDESFRLQLFVNRAQLIQTLERASNVSRETSRGKGCVVRFDVESESLEISAEVADEGMIRESLACSCNSDDGMNINFNARYLLDMLKAVEEESVEMNLSGPSTPSTLRPDRAAETENENENENDTETESYLYLLLPVRLPNQK